MEPNSRASRRRRLGQKRPLSQVVPVVVLLVSVCLLAAFTAYDRWATVRAQQQAWTTQGPACRVVAQPSANAVSHRRAPKTFQYGGIEFSRSFGGVSCAAVPDAAFANRDLYRVCQFNNPGVVAVTVSGRRTIFEPPAGARATVTVRRGVASCAVGGSFKY